MNLSERLNADMKDAMRAKEEGKLLLSVIRLIKSAAKYQEIEKGRPLNEEELIEVIARELKQRRDVLPEYEKNQRTEMVDSIKQEMAILMNYLPKQLSDDELRELIKDVISQTGASGPKDMGKVMGKITPLTKGKADGRLVSQLVKEALSALEN